MWQLKTNQPPFEMVDGPMAGRQFGHGIEYPDVPADLECRFDHSNRDIKTITENMAELAQAKCQKKDKETTDA